MGVMGLSQWDKLIADILREDPTLRFESLYKALIKIGYTVSQPGGGSSHYTFRKAGVCPSPCPGKRPSTGHILNW